MFDFSNDNKDNIVLKYTRLSKEKKYNIILGVNYLLPILIVQCCEKKRINDIKRRNGDYICIVYGIAKVLWKLIELKIL